MDDQALWQVSIANGVGPVTLGASRRQVLESLKAFGVHTRFNPNESERSLRIRQLEICFSFAEDGSQVLKRIDVKNPRVHFANWDVLGKPIHKAVRLFKCADSETLWCSSYDESSQRDLEMALNGHSKLKKTGDVALLRRGTLWIPALGLGFTLKEGQIFELHVTKPENAPKFGTGTWNAAQKTMSELGRIPKRDRAIGGDAHVGTSLGERYITTALVVALGFVGWRAIDLQWKWNSQPNVPASVIDAVPPPPAPFGNQFLVRYLDADEHTHEVTMERMDFFEHPKLDSTVNIRYLPESPDHPLGDRRLVDIGMNYGLPRAGVVVAIYAVLLLIFGLHRWVRTRIV